eukprot:Phypoly_transcript_03217.p1 GENE.Phypoly_transcript_03217~~Phypoly_transcript_03217.p1  ORF type:complete len:415 (+),score=57.87 Phypoly_transcript_03217:1234-2478(+)
MYRKYRNLSWSPFKMLATTWQTLIKASPSLKFSLFISFSLSIRMKREREGNIQTRRRTKRVKCTKTEKATEKRKRVEEYKRVERKRVVESEMHPLEVVCTNPQILGTYFSPSLKSLCSVNSTMCLIVSRFMCERYIYSYDRGRFTHLEPKRIQVSHINIFLPPNLTHLYLSQSFNQPFDGSILPLTLLALFFGQAFNHQVPHLPLSLTSLQFGFYKQSPTFAYLAGCGEFNQKIDFLPPGLTHLTIGGYSFNQKVDSLPCTLTHLALGHGFNSSLDHLPPSLTHLTLNFSFNRLVDHLPRYLTHLTFGTQFDQPITCLPSSLTHLTLGQKFNQPLTHLPKGLLSLTLGSFFSQSLASLPPLLFRLQLWTHQLFCILSLLQSPPPSLLQLYVPKGYSHLPLLKDLDKKVVVDFLE